MPRRVALLVNPTSGKGRAARLVSPVADRLRHGGLAVDVRQGRDGRDALALARAAVAGGVDALVVLGGDGMAFVGVNAVAGTATPLGIVPAGTGNDLATELGLTAGGPLVAADAVVAGRSRTVDAVAVGDQWYGGVLGAGFDSAVNERANAMRWPKGRRRYDLAILAELRTFRPMPFRLELDGEPWETEAMLVAVGNGTSYGAGMRVCPGARLDDGLLDVTVLGPVSTLEFVRTFPQVFRGTHVEHPAVTVRRAAQVTLDAPGLVAYADGERLAALPLTCRCVPGALQVLVPPAP